MSIVKHCPVCRNCADEATVKAAKDKLRVAISLLRGVNRWLDEAAEVLARKSVAADGFPTVGIEAVQAQLEHLTDKAGWISWKEMEDGDDDAEDIPTLLQLEAGLIACQPFRHEACVGEHVVLARSG